MRSDELRGKRADLIKEARRIYEEAEGSEEGPSAESRETFDRTMAAADEMQKDIERAESLERSESSLTQPQERRVAPEGRAPLPYEDEVDKVIEKVESTKRYHRAFDTFLRTGSQSELRDLSVGSATAGGNLAPTGFQVELLQVVNDSAPMRTISRILTIDNDRQFPINDGRATATWTAEAVAYSENDPTFAQLTLSALKAAIIVQVSEELVADSAFDIQSYLATEMGEAIGTLENTAYTTGGGSTDPQGWVGRADTGVTAGSATTITGDEIIDLYHALSPKYRSRATWVMEDATLKHIRLKKDSTGQYLWAPGLTAGTPDILLGRPVVTNEAVASIAASASVIGFGDFSKYYIADRAGVFVQRLDERYADTGQVGFRAFHRTDGNLMLTEAVKLLVMSS